MAFGAGVVSSPFSIPGPPEPPGHGRPNFAGYGPPEPPRPGIGVDLRNLIILVMIVAVIFGAVRQCQRTPEPKPQLPPQEKSPPSETPQALPSETPQAKHMASCRTAAERMDKNGALPRDYSINCPYWQRWTHNEPPHAQVPPQPPHTLVPPEQPRTPVRPAPESPRPYVFADPDPPHEKDAPRIWRSRRDPDWCCCQF